MRMNNQLRESEIHLQKAFKLAPENPDIRLLLAEFYQLSGNDEEAINLLEESVNNSPNHIKTLYELTQLHAKIQNSGSIIKAEKNMQGLAELLLPSNLIVTFKLVELLLQNQDYNGSLYYLEKLIKRSLNCRAVQMN